MYHISLFIHNRIIVLAEKVKQGEMQMSTSPWWAEIVLGSRFYLANTKLEYFSAFGMSEIPKCRITEITGLLSPLDECSLISQLYFKLMFIQIYFGLVWTDWSNLFWRRLFPLSSPNRGRCFNPSNWNHSADFKLSMCWYRSILQYVY